MLMWQAAHTDLIDLGETGEAICWAVSKDGMMVDLCERPPNPG